LFVEPSKVAPALAVVVADDEMHRRAEQREIALLVHVLLRSVDAVGVFLGHERVAEIHMKQRLVRRCARQRPLVKRAVGVVVQMRVGGDSEHQRVFTRAGGC
jgi:hypothetical protein